MSYNIALVDHISGALELLRAGTYSVACVALKDSWVVVPKGDTPVKALTKDVRFGKSAPANGDTDSFVTFSFKGNRADLLNALIASIGNIGQICDV
jgi:hypothetical protein